MRLNVKRIATVLLGCTMINASCDKQSQVALRAQVQTNKAYVYKYGTKVCLESEGLERRSNSTVSDCLESELKDIKSVFYGRAYPVVCTLSYVGKLTCYDKSIGSKSIFGYKGVTSVALADEAVCWSDFNNDIWCSSVFKDTKHKIEGIKAEFVSASMNTMCALGDDRVSCYKIDVGGDAKFVLRSIYTSTSKDKVASFGFSGYYNQVLCYSYINVKGVKCKKVNSASVSDEMIFSKELLFEDAWYVGSSRNIMCLWGKSGFCFDTESPNFLKSKIEIKHVSKFLVSLDVKSIDSMPNKSWSKF